MALREAEILTYSKATDWRWIPSSLNPADITTKPHELGDVSLTWFNGPEFLKLEEKHWPRTPQLETNASEEILKILHIRVEQQQQPEVYGPEAARKRRPDDARDTQSRTRATPTSPAGIRRGTAQHFEGRNGVPQEKRTSRLGRVRI